MASTETKTAESVIVGTIQELVKRRGGEAIEVRPESNFLTDIEMDSLELAELSGVLADELGREPFSDGIFPETVADLVAFYKS